MNIRPLNAEKSHERSRVILGLVSRREVLFETRIEKIVQKLKYFIKTQGKIQNTHKYLANPLPISVNFVHFYSPKIERGLFEDS